MLAVSGEKASPRVSYFLVKDSSVSLPFIYTLRSLTPTLPTKPFSKLLHSGFLSMDNVKFHFSGALGNVEKNLPMVKPHWSPSHPINRII